MLGNEDYKGIESLAGECLEVCLVLKETLEEWDLMLVILLLAGWWYSSSLTISAGEYDGLL